MGQDVYYPRKSIDTQYYWDGCKINELRYQQCGGCGEVIFHPRAACPYCLSGQLDWKVSKGEGEIYSFAVQHIPVNKFNPGRFPITLGIVALDEGYHMFTEIDSVDMGELKIGARVRVFFDAVAEDLTLPKFSLISVEGTN